jgi:hypothetical protein
MLYHSVVRTPMGAYVNLMPLRGQGIFFWREVSCLLILAFATTTAIALAVDAAIVPTTDSSTTAVTAS